MRLLAAFLVALVVLSTAGLGLAIAARDWGVALPWVVAMLNGVVAAGLVRQLAWWRIETDTLTRELEEWRGTDDSGG